MKTFLSILITVFSLNAFAQQYDRFFTDSTMRVDYYHTGTKGQESMALDKVYLEGPWPGSKTQLIDQLNRGDYLLRVFDFNSNALIYSRGFSLMFNEWQTTDESLNGMVRTFSETVRFPFPKERVVVSISRRDKFVAPGEKLAFREVFSTTIDPTNPTEVNNEKRGKRFAAFDVVNNGPPETKADIVILGDGYAKGDLEKFRADARHFSEVLLNTSPFKEHRSDFNIRAIEVVSEESGIDKPDKNIWKKTKYAGKVGAFEGAGYVSTGLYRPSADCRMFSLGLTGFDPVCAAAINDVIATQTK